MKPYYEDAAAGIVIYCGDAREVLPLLKADLLVTDPPYGINFAGMPTKWQRRAGQAPEEWDREPFDDVALLLGCAPVQCIWGGNYYPLPSSRGWMAWVKPDAPPSMGSVEFAWTNLDQNARHLIHSIGATNAERVGHPNQKPLRVMKWCLNGLPEGSVIDPFMGSGTTIRAAKDLGRAATGIEISERYCEMAVERLRQGVLL